MNSLPLHPALVHLPLGLALLMPLLTAGFAWALWTGRVPARGWLAVVALQTLLLGSGLMAIRSGGAEEDRVESIVAETAIERHEAFAEQFVWAVGLTLVLATLVMVFRRPAVARGLASGMVVATVVVAGLALRTGHAGGQLVYVHNAGAAYAGVAGSGSGRAAVATPGEPTRADASATGTGAVTHDRDDDDDDEGRER